MALGTLPIVTTEAGQRIPAQPVISVDGNGDLVAPGSGTQVVVGNAASGTADSGNPVKVGGRYAAVLPTLADGQRSDLILTSKGQLRVNAGDGFVIADNRGNTGSGFLDGTGNAQALYVYTAVYNGAGWDRARGTSKGASAKPGMPTAGTNLSGIATTISGAYNIPADPLRHPGDVQGQNISPVNIGFNEFGGTAVIGSTGTYTVPPGGTFTISTNQQVNFIAASGTAGVTVTGI